MWVMMSAGMLRPSTSCSGSLPFPRNCPALVQRPDAETGMEQRRGIECDRDREKLPERGVIIDAGGKGIHRDVAERVIEKMADQIGKQHQPADETDLPHADAADGFCQ